MGSKEGAEVQVAPGILVYDSLVPSHMLDSGEIVILALKPSLWFLVFVSVRWLLAAAAIMLVVPWASKLYADLPVRMVTQAVLAVTALRLIGALLQWSSRLYVLTNRRVLCCRGVLRVGLFEAQLVQIRNTYVKSPTVEKLCGVGSIGFSLQGSQQVDAWWDQIANPVEVHQRVRRAIEKALDHHTPY